MIMRRAAEQVDLRVVSSHACELGENPLWHAEGEHLYWCDINAGRLLRHDFVTSKNELLVDGGGNHANKIGGFTIEADGAVLLFMSGGKIQRWHDGRLEALLEGHPEMANTRFNDVIADPIGRVFCGTMSTETSLGKLYRLNLDRTLTPVVVGVGCANGLAFTRDRKHLYFTDSHARTITSFDLDLVSGALSQPRIFVRTAENDGLPDGMTIDAEDHIWSAHWDGGVIIRYSPSGEEARRISVPVPKVTSLTFSGHDLRTLCITTASSGGPDPESSQSGNLFAFEPGVRGVAEFRSRICTG